MKNQRKCSTNILQYYSSHKAELDELKILESKTIADSYFKLGLHILEFEDSLKETLLVAFPLIIKVKKMDSNTFKCL
jgi:hypothetical protein